MVSTILESGWVWEQLKFILWYNSYKNKVGKIGHNISHSHITYLLTLGNAPSSHWKDM